MKYGVRSFGPDEYQRTYMVHLLRVVPRNVNGRVGEGTRTVRKEGEEQMDRFESETTVPPEMVVDETF